MYDVDDGEAFTSAGTTVACSSPSAMKGSSTASVCRAVSNRPNFLNSFNSGHVAVALPTRDFSALVFDDGQFIMDDSDKPHQSRNVVHNDFS